MNILSRISNFKFLISNFWRWHPEVALRYLPIVKEIKNEKLKIKNDNQKFKILEVGSGWLGISPYLGQPVVGLDEDFEDKKFYLLKQIKGDILKIPFENESYDFVICVDVLEHLPKEKRVKAIEEILRVARKEVFLALPCGEKSLAQDRQIDREYRQIFGKPFTFLTQHIKYGLPERKELIQLIKLAASRQKKQINIRIQGNENLGLRKFLMKGWMTKNFFVDVLFRKVFLLLIPFFPFFDKLPHYRQTFLLQLIENSSFRVEKVDRKDDLSSLIAFLSYLPSKELFSKMEK